jgi:hypothetical protein
VLDENSTIQDEPADADGLSDVQDDAVIGRAFRLSMICIITGLLIIAVALGYTYWPTGQPEEVITEVYAPTVRDVGNVAPPKLLLTDITKESGIEFVHYTGKEGQRLLPETMGGGGGFFDFDNDGDQDILFVNSNDWPWAKKPTSPQPTMQLYANDGNGQFTDVTSETGLTFSMYGMGCAFGDYDNDGWMDIYVTCVGKNKLLRNAEGRFEDVTDQMNVAGRENDWSCPATWFDFDRDGKLDLLVGNYVDWSRQYDIEQNFTLVGLGRAYGQPTSFGGTFLNLYRNTGDGFVDVAEAAGLHIKNPATDVPVGKSLAFGLIDIDRNGWLDVVVANDTVRNFLFINQADGTFKETGQRAGIAYDNSGKATGAMGVDTAYYRNDNALGIAIGNFANEPSSIFVSKRRVGQFTDAAIATGLGPQTRLQLTFGMFFADLDLDSRLDMVCTNGHLEEEISKVQPSQRYAQPPQLFWNAGKQSVSEWVQFSDEQLGSDFGQPMVGRGAAYADIDADGDLDLLLMANGQAPRLLRNDQQLGHHWLRVQLASSGANRDALGAEIRLIAGDQEMRRTVTPTRSYISQSELPQTFGLGEKASIDELSITWPDGSIQECDIPEIDQLVVITKR